MTTDRRRRRRPAKPRPRPGTATGPPADPLTGILRQLAGSGDPWWAAWAKALLAAGPDGGGADGVGKRKG